MVGWKFLEFIKVSIVLAITLIFIFGGILLLIFSFFLFDVDQYLQYNFKISSKESLIEVFWENQSEFDRIAREMKKIYEAENEYIILLRGRAEYRKKGLESAIFKEAPIALLSVSDSGDNGLEVNFHCAPAFCPDDYTTWGIYYSEDDLPQPPGGGELEIKDEGYYVCEAPGQYYYETEKITDNWYYYQCWYR